MASHLWLKAHLTWESSFHTATLFVIVVQIIISTRIRPTCYSFFFWKIGKELRLTYPWDFSISIQSFTTGLFPFGWDKRDCAPDWFSPKTENKISKRVHLVLSYTDCLPVFTKNDFEALGAPPAQETIAHVTSNVGNVAVANMMLQLDNNWPACSGGC